jgi:hypothetical protein
VASRPVARFIVIFAAHTWRSERAHHHWISRPAPPYDESPSKLFAAKGHDFKDLALF